MTRLRRSYEQHPGTEHPEPLRPPSYTDECWWHGTEPITERTYRVCGECYHAWEKDDLIKAHGELAAEYGSVAPTDAELIFSCPLCIHDF